MDYDQFKQYVGITLANDGIELIVDSSYSKLSVNARTCAGMFEPESESGSPLLRYTEDELAFETLLHEFCHSRQHVEDSLVWQQSCTDNDGLYAIYGDIWHSIVDEWIFNPDFQVDVKHLLKQLRLDIAVELDCEIRAAHLIDRLNLYLDKTKYIQQANALLYFYAYLFDLEPRWFLAGRTPYRVDFVWKNMPGNFHTYSYFKPLPEHLKSLFDYCVGI